MNPLSDYDPGQYFNILATGFITKTLWVDVLVISIILICFAFSSFFSMAETALSSANPIRLKKLVEEKKRGARKAELLIENYDRTITTILIGNNLANIGASTASVFIFTNIILNPSIANITSTIVMTLLIITFGEIIPKTYAKAHSTKSAVKIAPLLWFFYKMFFPLAYLFMKLSSSIRGKKTVEDVTVTGEELETIIDTMEDQGIIDEDHADLLQGALTLGNKKVYEIMTPRVDVEAIEVDDTIDEILETFFDSKYTRLPVYSEDKDNILGVLQQKDFLSAVIKAKNKGDIDIKTLITAPLYVTKATRVDDLIKEMQELKRHFAIVSDEYGGTSGIVTMEDALEELVGEIYDEYDFDEDDSYMLNIGENKYLISADYELKELFEELDIGPAPSVTYATVGGYIYDLCEGLPEIEKVISVESTKSIYDEEKLIDLTYRLTFKLVAVENRRILELELLVEDITNLDEQGLDENNNED